MKPDRYQRILLIIPPFYRLTGGKNNWIHLGLSYVAAVLHRHGFEVKVYNTDHVEMEEDVSLRAVFEGEHLYRQIILDDQHAIWKEIREVIGAYQPDLVGITIVFSKLLRSAERIAAITKEVCPAARVVVGGSHATLIPDSLNKPYFDYIVRGEGEYAMLELARGAEPSNVPGVGYKSPDGRLMLNNMRPFIDNLDELPFPDVRLQLIPIEDPENNFGTLAFSRGCNLKCIFCSSPELWGKEIRYRTIENVLKEIEGRYYEYGVKRYYFADDNMTLNRRYAKEFMRGIIHRGLKITWLCEARVRTFDEELLDLMREAGCSRIKLGVESGSDRTLRYMKKGITAKHIYETTAMIRKAGIPYTAYILIGMPNETMEDIMETYRMCLEIDPDYISLSIATPQVGTELYSIAQDLGIRFPEDMWSGYSHQSDTCLLNPLVDQKIIDMFLALNERKGKGRTVKEIFSIAESGGEVNVST